jgi:hypothetical protein
MFCIKCGFALLEESAFCSRCGVRTEAPLQQRTGQSPPEENRPHSLGKLVGTVVVVGVALAAVVGLAGAITPQPEARPISWSQQLGPTLRDPSPDDLLRRMQAGQAAQQANRVNAAMNALELQHRMNALQQYRINAALQQANMPRFRP